MVTGLFLNRKGRRSLHPFRPKSYHKLNLLMLWQAQNNGYFEQIKKGFNRNLVVFGFIGNWGIKFI